MERCLSLSSTKMKSCITVLINPPEPSNPQNSSVGLWCVCGRQNYTPVQQYNQSWGELSAIRRHTRADTTAYTHCTHKHHTQTHNCTHTSPAPLHIHAPHMQTPTDMQFMHTHRTLFARVRGTHKHHAHATTCAHSCLKWFC